MSPDPKLETTMAIWSNSTVYYGVTAIGGISISGDVGVPAGTVYEVTSDSSFAVNESVIMDYLGIVQFEGYTAEENAIFYDGIYYFVAIKAGNTTTYTAGDIVAYTAGALAICFLRGTLILTARGEVPVERLRAGDLVATKFGGLRPVRWMGTQRFEGRLAGRGHQPIRFAAGSLGNGLPSCDLRVSPGHAMLVQYGQGGEVLAHAGALVNGSTITQERVRGEIEYFHIDLGPHDCVLANGAWAESYFEDRNRDAFHNAAEFHALNPGHAAERQANCLPIVTAEHPGIDGVRRLLAPREVRRAA